MTICKDKRPCFARTSKNVCKLLKESYDGKVQPCPFCKASMDDITPTEVLFAPKKMAVDVKKEPS